MKPKNTLHLWTFKLPKIRRLSVSKATLPRTFSMTEGVKRRHKWSLKYKRSINCKRPRGFSQKQHCKYGRKTKRIFSS
jgi:hypothetical protein